MDSTTIKNSSLDSVFGGPLLIRDMDEAGRVTNERVDMKMALTIILRSRDDKGQSRIVKSQDDSDRIQSIGRCLQSADGMIEFASGDFKWMVNKINDIGWQIFPTDISTIIDNLKRHEVELESSNAS